MMRIAVAGIGTETNSFNRHWIGRDEFYQYAGEEILDLWYEKRQNSVICGIIDACERQRVELVPLYYARTLPAGSVKAEAYKEMRDEICQRLQEAVPVDALCLGMHGSMSVVKEDGGICYDDPEGDLMAELHQLRPDLPLHLALDMHATLSEGMLYHADSISLYKTAPHIDMLDTGRLCADIAIRSFREGKRCAVSAQRVPLVLSGEISMTDQEPMKSLIAELYQAESLPHVLSASYALGFPWADSPYLGTLSLVTSFEEDLLRARATCRELARKIWKQRKFFNFGMETASEEEAIAMIRENQNAKPIVISDVGDNATAGGSEDCVNFLNSLVQANIPPCLFAVVYDEQVYKQLLIGKEEQEVELGRFFGEDYGLELHVELRSFFQYQGREAAIVRVGQLDIIIAAQRMPVATIDIFGAAGIDYQDYRAIIIKCGYHGEDLCAIASKNILALTRGDTDPILERLPYKRVPRPIFPLDQTMNW